MLLDRRHFLAATGVAAAAAATPLRAAAAPPAGARIRLAVKWGMIDVAGGVGDRFAACRAAGLEGVELISPLPASAAELRSASQATGVPIHGTVNDRHWQVRMSDPDPAVRDRAATIMTRAVRDTAALGGHSVLLVPGVVGDDATHDEVWSRSTEVIRDVLPTAAALGVRVLIENVWNGFCETPERLRDYVDGLASPWVGVYYDLGNAQKFSPSERWIRVLGRRIVKLDVKDWGVAGGFGKIGDGDVDWAAVRAALDAIGFTGWATAEVAGGDAARLTDIAGRMRHVLGVA